MYSSTCTCTVPLVPSASALHIGIGGELRQAGERVMVNDQQATLQAYFAQHRIQEELNVIINEIVSVRPAEPLRWLAVRLRRSAVRSTPAETIPTGASGKKTGARIAAAWADSESFRAGPSAGGAGGGTDAPAVAKAASTGSALQVSIEPGGTECVLVAICSR